MAMGVAKVQLCRRGLLAFLLAFFACVETQSAEPKRVMLLHSFGRDFKPFSDYSRNIREQLERQAPWPLDLMDQLLASARVSGENSEGPFIEYLERLYADKHVDLIITFGGPAANFAQGNRDNLSPEPPFLWAEVNERRVQTPPLTKNNTVFAKKNAHLAIFESILRVLPAT